MERTFAMIKPDPVQAGFIGEALNRIEADDLRIVAMRMVALSPNQVDALYAEHREKSFYTAMRTFLLEGPVVLLVLEGENAVARYRALMGATDPRKAAHGTLRRPVGARMATDAPMFRNGVHGSDSSEAATREISIFFPPPES